MRKGFVAITNRGGKVVEVPESTAAVMAARGWFPVTEAEGEAPPASSGEGTSVDAPSASVIEDAPSAPAQKGDVTPPRNSKTEGSGPAGSEE